MRRNGVRAALGLVFLAGGLVLYWSLGRLVAATTNPLLVGGVIGTTVAIGGALKDSQLEGFKPAKFVRSPIMSMLGAVVLIPASRDPLLIALAVIGFERVAVELYKTFLTRQVRGIHADRPAVYPHWFRYRWVFAMSFSACVLACAALFLRR
jgi:hypothetical protein